MLSVAPDVKNILSVSLIPRSCPSFSRQSTSTSFFMIELPPRNCEAGVPLRHACTASKTAGGFGQEVAPLFRYIIQSSFQNIEVHNFCNLLDHLCVITEDQHLMMSESCKIVHEFSCIVHLDVVERTAVCICIFRTDNLAFLDAHGIACRIVILFNLFHLSSPIVTFFIGYVINILSPIF